MANDRNHFADSFALADGAPLKDIEFQPSTIETHDFAMFNYINETCNFHVNSNKGWRKIPVIWVGAERAFQVKERKEMRDSGGMLVLPLIAIERLSITKDPARKGMMPANVRDNPDEQGGSVTIARRIKQDKTRNFAVASGTRKDTETGGTRQRYYPRVNKKIVIRSLSIPIPIYVNIDYKIY